jgi:diguanylate cyclase (GGDEF)-like protein
MEQHDAGQHFSALLSRLVVERVRAVCGEDALLAMLVEAGLDTRRDQLVDDAGWLSYGTLRRLLEAAAVALGSPEALGDLSNLHALDVGTMPDMDSSMLGMGSPEVFIAELNSGNMGISTVERCWSKEVGPQVWDISRRLDEAFEPYEELCALNRGAAATIPALFGYPNVHTEELSCQRRGDDCCTIRLSWEGEDDQVQSAALVANKLAVVERQLEAFQQTVAQLVGTDDLATTLRRITDAARSSIRVPQFVLAMDPLPWPAQLVYGFGLSQTEAEAVAARADAPDDLVVEIVSGNRRHGRLIAVGGVGLVLPSSQSHLRAYAQLAAAAVAGARAVEEARRQATTAKVLLDLSMRLARIGSVKELAERIVGAVPTLVSCDRASFGIVDAGGRYGTIVAAAGYDAEGGPTTVGRRMAMTLPPDVGIVYYTGNAVAAVRRRAAAISVPVEVNGKVSGWITADVTEDPSRLAASQELEERMLGLAALASTAMHNALLLDRVSYQADHDALTGLPNRGTFVESLQAAGEHTSVLFVDLDDFKNVNDALGHHAGDQLLCEVAMRLRRAVREGDLVARFGGDEFAVIVSDARPGAAQRVAQRVLAAFNEPFELGGQRTIVSASVGLAGDSASADDLLHNADVAMYRAKAAGKGRLALFEPGMDHAATERLAMHADLAEAINCGQLRLLYQPVLGLDDGMLHSGEALVRWEHPTLGLLTPDRFIGLAEDTGLIGALGAWMLEEACCQAVTWPSRLAVAVNVSARQLDHDGIVDEIAGCLERSGLAASRLLLEVSQSIMANDGAAAIARLERLRGLGVRIAIGDFGTGYSSLTALAILPIDVLKIDRAFINQIRERPGAAELMRVLIDMGQALHLEVVTEGVDEIEQMLAPPDDHWPLRQGSRCSPAVPAAEFLAFVKAAEKPSAAMLAEPSRT